MRIFVLGVTGMLGNAVYRRLSQVNHLEVHGTLRSSSGIRLFPEQLQTRLHANVDVENFDALTDTLQLHRPDVVINCVGLVKQLAAAEDPLVAIPVNSLLPHRLAKICALTNSRLVHISTDCVFDGAAGNYMEDDIPNAHDLYGRSKLLGEVDYPNAITLRTSIIGHELASAHGVVEWFLSQKSSVRGYSKAVFSGLPTVELAGIIAKFIIPAPHLHGLYHVSSAPISKLNLLRLIAAEYGSQTEIVPVDNPAINRSLDSSRFQAATGYTSPQWPALVSAMHDFR